MNAEELRAMYGPQNKISVLDGTGHVAFVDCMGDDEAIEAAARLSYQKGTRKTSDTRNLIRYMFRKGHSTPFEAAVIKLDMKIPIFVARQLVRHRTQCLAGGTDLHFDLPGAEKRERRQRHNVTIADFHRMWTDGTEHPISKKKPCFEDRIEPATTYTVPELALLVERTEFTLRNMISEGRLSATKLQVTDPRQPALRVTGRAWLDFAERTHMAKVPMRARLSKMQLRCVNEDTGQVSWTSVTDCWVSGEKEVYEIRLQCGVAVTMSMDHRVLTDAGWKRLRDFAEQPDSVRVAAVVRPYRRAKRHEIEYTRGELAQEEWRPVVGFETRYEVSNLGRVRSFLNQKQNRRAVPQLKALTSTEAGYKVVTLCEDMQSTPQQVHRLVLGAFVGPCPALLEGCHNDGNGFDNRLQNLRWGTPESNLDDREAHDTITSLECVYSPIESITEAGMEQTYDIEVEGPWHNFSANGMIVHNSISELSARYSILPEEFYTPPVSQICFQDEKNKQGREGPFPLDEAEQLQNQMAHEAEDAFATYRQFIEAGMARETARMGLPLSTYTQWNTTMSLRNLLHMLGLRLDPHAQWETRQVAAAIWAIVRDWVPLTAEAFVDYQLEAATFSRMDLAVVREIVSRWKVDEEEVALSDGRDPAVHFAAEVSQLLQDFGISNTRERVELLAKLGLA